MCDFSWTFFVNYSLNKSDDLCFHCSFVPFCRKVCILFQGGWWAQLGCQLTAHLLCSCSENCTFAIGCLFLLAVQLFVSHYTYLQCCSSAALTCASSLLHDSCLCLCPRSACPAAPGSCWAVVHFTTLLLLILFIQIHVWARLLHSGCSTFLCILPSYFALLSYQTVTDSQIVHQLSFYPKLCVCECQRIFCRRWVHPSFIPVLIFYCMFFIVYFGWSILSGLYTCQEIFNTMSKMSISFCHNFFKPRYGKSFVKSQTRFFFHIDDQVIKFFSCSVKICLFQGQDIETYFIFLSPCFWANSSWCFITLDKLQLLLP